MKKLLTAIALMMSTTLFAQAQGSDYDVSKDAENGAVVFKGQVTFADLEKEPSFSWLKSGADTYKPDSNAVKYLKQHLRNYEMVVLMGTWCDDSQNLMPKFYKVLQLTGYPMAKYNMFGVDRAKTTKNIEHRLYKLDKVPTIIVYKNHNELGRIVETVKKNVETDLVQLIRKDVEASEAK